MKLINYIMASVLFLSATLLGSCSEEETTLSKAVLASASELNFEAEGAQPKTITVYADADWVMEDLLDYGIACYGQRYDGCDGVGDRQHARRGEG